MTSTPELDAMKAEAPELARTMHALLGCEFGRTINHQNREAPCEEAAVQIVVLHDSSGVGSHHGRT